MLNSLEWRYEERTRTRILERGPPSVSHGTGSRASPEFETFGKFLQQVLPQLEQRGSIISSRESIISWIRDGRTRFPPGERSLLWWWAGRNHIHLRDVILFWRVVPLFVWLR